MARKEEVRLKLNKYRVPVKKCCMSCTFRGSVKCREYLMFVLAVREDEALAIERGEEVEVKTIEALRAEFLEHHGAIYEIL